MATEIKKEIRLEIARVLFMDIIGYSRLPINEQRTALEKLNQSFAAPMNLGVRTAHIRFVVHKKLRCA